MICTYREWLDNVAQQKVAFTVDILIGMQYTGSPAVPTVDTVTGFPNVACRIPGGVTLTGIMVESIVMP